jgi:hypothetical protein
MRWPRILFPLIGLIMLGPSTISATTTMQIQDPIDLDHGFRYHDWRDDTFGCAIALDGERILFTYGDLY